MSYTVKQLAKISGVTVRTLHHYDEVGLLAPAYVGENGYRYYEREQLLLLQQILFFREIGLSLQEIGRILTRSNFSKIAALKKHRGLLEREIERNQKLIRTIDRTVRNLKGDEEMEAKEYYYGFDSDRQKRYEEEIRELYGEQAESLIEESKRKLKKEDFAAFKRDCEELNRRLAQLIERGLAPGDEVVQEEVKNHLALIRRYYTPTKEIYRGLGSLYVDHSEFKEFYGRHHPALAQFLKEAIEIFVDTSWK